MRNERSPADRPDSEAGPEATNAEDLLWECVARLNRGESIDEAALRKEHPAEAEEVLRQLEAFKDIGATETGAGACGSLGTLGDYTLRRQIGRGGMGIVYDAWQNSMNRQVALKVLPAGVAADRRTAARFLREAQTAGQLNHQNVVAVYGLGIEANTPYYTMEFVAGETLAQVLARLRAAEGMEDEKKTILRGMSGLFGRGDIATADSGVEPKAPAPRREGLLASGDLDLEYYAKLAKAFAGVADGLQHAHSKGIVHRDIKPSNLILDREGRLRVLDFGLAHLEGQESLTVSGDLVGTVQYMSPEQARRRKIPIDHRTDVYSLGATLFEMLTLRPPFKGKDHQDTLSQIIERDPAEPSKLNRRVPRDLETIVLKCLRKDPAERYGTAEALAQDLKRFVRGDPIEAQPPTRWERLARRLRRHRWRLCVAAAFAVLIFSLALLAHRGRHASREAMLARYEPAVLAVLKRILAGHFSQRVVAGEAGGGFEFSGVQAFPLSPEDVVRLAKPTTSEDLEKAVQELEPVAQAVERPDGHYHLARAYRLLEQTEEARREARRALERKADFVPAEVLQIELSGIPEDRKRREIERLRSTYERRPGWQRAWIESYTALRERDWPRAIDSFGQLIALGTGGEQPYVGSAMEAYVGCGVARMAAGSYLPAIEDFSAARALAPGLEPNLLLGKAYFLGGEKEAAEGIFEGLYGSAGPGEKAEAALWVTAVYDSVAGREEALRWAERLGDGTPVKERLRSHFLHRLGRRREAIEAGRRAAQCTPGGDPAACMILASALLDDVWSGPGPQRGRKLIEAYCASRMALALDPGNAFAGSLSSVAGTELRHEVFNYLRRESMKAHGMFRAFVVGVLALAAPRPAEGQGGFFGDVRTVEGVSRPGVLEWGPDLSADGLELFYQVRESAPLKPWALWAATRESKDGPWTSVRPLVELNGPLAGASLLGRSEPCISSNGRELYFCVCDDAPTMSTLWMATRSDRSEFFSGARPLDEINNHALMHDTSLFAGPDISADGLELFFCATPARGGGRLNLYAATREDAGEPFTEVRALSEINLPTYDDLDPGISGDRLTIFWSDFDPPFRNGISTDLWMASRPSPDEPFGAVGNVGFPVNTGMYEAAPDISPDWPAAGSKLYFCRIPGDWTTGDIYVATWHLDCNGNGLDDTEELVAGTEQDCNGNGIPDTCDIDSGTSQDVNADGIPDECPPDPGKDRFRRGDANADNRVDIGDAISVLGYLFGAAQDPAKAMVAQCPDTADANDDGTIDIADAISILGHLFAQSGDLPAPFGACGSDPSPDALDCPSFAPCAGP